MEAKRVIAGKAPVENVAGDEQRPARCDQVEDLCQGIADTLAAPHRARHLAQIEFFEHKGAGKSRAVDRKSAQYQQRRKDERDQPLRPPGNGLLGGQGRR